MIIEEQLPAGPSDDHDEEVFDLERPERPAPSRRRLVRVAVAAALALGVTIAAALVIRPSNAGSATPTPPSFELVDPSAESPSSAESAASSESAAPSATAPAISSLPVVVPVVADESFAPDVIEPLATVPAGAARFVAGPPIRVLDTRDGDVPTPDAEFRLAVPQSDSLAFSVSIIGSERSGTVLFDGRRGTVEALRLPGPGAITTNLTIVPVSDGEVTVRSSAGGHLVIDVVGAFEPVDAPVAAGRFVAVDRYRIGRLITADEGRELELPLSGRAWIDDIAYDAEGSQTLGPDYDLSDATAVLALITADVAGEGGAIRIGPAHGEYGQMLMWGPASGEDRIRQGLAILTPTPDGLAALRYDGGSELTVEVLGYFTGDVAPEGDDGLLLPPRPQTLVTTEIPAGSNRIVGGFDRGASSAVVSLNPTSGVPGRLGASVIAVNDGAGSIWTRDDVAVSVALLAEFR